MEPATHLEHLRVDSAALLAACRTDPAASVPACPGWTRTELLGHVAGVHSWVRAQLQAGPDVRVRFSAIDYPPSGDELPGWYEANAAAMIEGLAAMDLGATWQTWAGPQPGTFFPRRMAQETAVHRRDVDPAPLDPALAVDGVDELLDLFTRRLPAERFADASGTIHLHATDTGDGAGEWLVHLTPEGIHTERGHAKGDVALRGTAGDLLLWTWNRAPVDERFEVFGDTALLDRWRTLVTF